MSSCYSVSLFGPTGTGVSLEVGYQRSTTAYVASHHWLLNLTFKRVVVVISSTETTMSLCTSYFYLQLYSRLLITYGHLLKKIMKPLQVCEMCIAWFPAHTLIKEFVNQSKSISIKINQLILEILMRHDSVTFHRFSLITEWKRKSNQ